MKIKTYLLTMLILILLTGCIGRSQETVEPIAGIDHPIGVGEVQLRVLDARIRRSMQTHYMMSYPQSGNIFYVVTLSIEGIDADPAVTLDWGTTNLILTNEIGGIAPSYAQRTLAGEQVEYKVGEAFSFIYLYYFEVLQVTNYHEYKLLLPDDQSISLGSIVQTPTQAQLSSAEINLHNVVAGGSHNLADAYHATVSGAQSNTASASHTTVGGGRENMATYFYATVGGGYANAATGRDTFIGGGSRNTASEAHATVAGGIQNTASAPDTTIAGGAYNLASDDYAVVAGGTRNTAEGYSSTIAGGAGNTTSADQATVSGGLGNQAIDAYATVSGGHGNIASGAYASIPGGFLNVAGGDFSLASGHRARVDADHSGVFIFADSNNFDFLSETADEFAIRATGGVRLVSSIDEHGVPIAGVSLPAGSGSWTTLSDRNAKENIILVDSSQILASLAEIPIATWNYTGQDPSIQHIGPMAQDFYARFGVGEDDTHISTVDADGVSLAAIQGLYAMVQEQEAKIDALEAQINIITSVLIGCVFMFIFLLWANIKRQFFPFPKE